MTMQEFFSKAGEYIEYRNHGSVVHFHYTHGFSRYDGKNWIFVIDYVV